MSFAPLLITWCCIILSVISKQIPPTISNATGDYYINSLSNLTNFQNDSILCSASHCFIICDIHKGCYNTTINASMSSILSFQCIGNSSCEKSTLLQGPSHTINILCTNYSACESSNINVSSTTNASIICSANFKDNLRGQDASYTPPDACYLTKFIATQSQNINVFCNTSSCGETSFYVNNSEQAHFTIQSAYYANIYATSVKIAVTLDCIGNCEYIYIHCPKEADCNINCVKEENCADIEIFIPDKYYQNLFLNCHEQSYKFAANAFITCENTGFKTQVNWNITDNAWECHTYGCCPWNIGNISCKPNENCSINCKDNINGCANKYIDASEAKSLTLECGTNKHQCGGAIVQCPALCEILCNGQLSCNYLSVNVTANVTQYINLTFTGQYWPGEYFNVTTGDIHQINSFLIDCSMGYGCPGSVVDLSNVKTFTKFLNISCFGCVNFYGTLNKVVSMDLIIGPTDDNALFYMYPLVLINDTTIVEYFNITTSHTNDAIVDISIMENVTGYISWDGVESYINMKSVKNNNAGNVFILCENCNYGGGFSRFTLENLNIVNVYCSQCSDITIDAHLSKYLNVTCTKACPEIIHCPYLYKNVCNIDVNIAMKNEDYEEQMNIHVPDNYIYEYLNLTVPSQSSTQIQFVCDGIDGDQTSKTAVYYGNGFGACTQRLNTQLDTCCPWYEQKVTIDCKQAEHCQVLCTHFNHSSYNNNCSYGLINGTLANSLSVTISGARDLNIICPIGRSCNISCVAGTELYCDYITIYYYGIGNEQDINSSIQVECSGTQCEYITIYAPHVSSIDFVNNHGWPYTTTIYSQYANRINVYCSSCDTMKIYGDYAHTFNFTCRGNCEYIFMNATFSSLVTVTAIGTLKYPGIHALNATNITINCVTSKKNAGCISGQYWFPSSGAILNCYGMGCHHIGEYDGIVEGFYIQTNISNLQFNIDGCGVCSSLFGCISSMTIYCDLYPYWDYIIANNKTQTFNRSTRNCIGDDCGCISLIQKAQNDFSTNKTYSLCPTLSNKKQLTTWEIVGICIASVVVLAVVIFGVIKYCKTKVNNAPLLVNETVE